MVILCRLRPEGLWYRQPFWWSLPMYGLYHSCIYQTGNTSWRTYSVRTSKYSPRYLSDKSKYRTIFRCKQTTLRQSQLHLASEHSLLRKRNYHRSPVWPDWSVPNKKVAIMWNCCFQVETSCTMIITFFAGFSKWFDEVIIKNDWTFILQNVKWSLVSFVSANLT